MIRRLLIYVFTLLAYSGLAQEFSLSENFDSYKDGDRIAQVQDVIRTWGNAAAADAPISSEVSHSPSNALKLATTAQNGGPSDIIIPFSSAGKHTEGKLRVEFWMYIAPDNEAYYNFQGGDAEGDIWATQFFSKKDGSFTIEDSERNVKAQGTVPMGQWVKTTWKINLTSNFWRCYFDDQLVAEFGNVKNAVSMADFYPVAQEAPYNSLFYIDDLNVAYYLPDSTIDNAAVYDIALARSGLLEGGKTTASATIKNVGLNAITSIETKWSYNGQSYNKTLDGVNLGSGASMEINAPEEIVASKDYKEVSFEIVSVNGHMDADETDNKKTAQLTIVVPAPYKKVLVEEATGTWCGWCPRGAVYMDLMTELYPDYFVGVAVHGGRAGEPMANEEHLSGIRDYVDGFPKIVTMRSSGNDPLEIEGLFSQRIQESPTAKVTVTKAQFNEDTRTMSVTVSAEFLDNVRGTIKLGAIMVEDSVTGDNPAYSQVNYYAGGSRGKMGGYENLPNPVPYSQMVYNHVSRSVFGNVKGVSAKARKAIKGDIITQDFELTDVPEEWDENHFRIVGFITVKSSKIDNVDQAYPELITASNDVRTEETSVKIAPNPFDDHTFITVGVKGTKEVQIRVSSITGQTLLQRDYGKVTGKSVFPLVAPELEKGVYLLNIRVGEEKIVKKIVKK